MEKILIFIPVYRCEKQLPRVLARIAALGEDAALFSQVLIVDNRSPDGTREAALAAMPSLPVPAVLVENDENYSLGGSHKVAFSYALEHGFDYVVVLHGDDQADIADLVPLLRRGEHRKMDSLLGLQRLPRVRQPLLQRIFIRLLRQTDHRPRLGPEPLPDRLSALRILSELSK